MTTFFALWKPSPPLPTWRKPPKIRYSAYGRDLATTAERTTSIVQHTSYSHEASGDIPQRFCLDTCSTRGGGDYTAGAIASFAFDLPYPAVDGNVLRVISRLLASELPIETPWAGSDSAPKRWRNYSPPNFPQANWGKPL